MSALPPETEQSDLMLAEAAKLDLVGMRHVHELLLASDEAKEVGVIVHAYSRVSRCMRQNLAMLARQKADRVKAEREAAQHEAGLRARGPDLEDQAIEERAVELQHAVDRVISAASDGDHKLHTDWAHRFDRESDDWIEKPDFLLEDLDTQVLRACRTLGLPENLAERWQDLPAPTFCPDPEPESAEDIAAANAFCREASAQLRAASGRAPTDPALPPPPWKNSG
jgi:hypothetical protein